MKIYMNHLIKDKDTKEPVICVEKHGRVTYARRVKIKKGKIKHGHHQGPVHPDVKVWIEAKKVKIIL